MIWDTSTKVRLTHVQPVASVVHHPFALVAQLGQIALSVSICGIGKATRAHGEDGRRYDGFGHDGQTMEESGMKSSCGMIDVGKGEMQSSGTMTVPAKPAE